MIGSDDNVECAMLYRNIMQITSRSFSRSTRCPDPDGVIASLQEQIWAQVRARFDERRDSVGLTQAELAKRLQIPRPQISLYLREPHRMTIKAAARLFHAMDAQLDCRLVDKGEPQ